MVVCKSPEFFAAPSLLHSACESAIGERMHKRYSLFIGLFCLLLMACGGGGGSGSGGSHGGCDGGGGFDQTWTRQPSSSVLSSQRKATVRSHFEKDCLFSCPTKTF